jgi:2-polyprenyl-3-methyl-5-hydroxy-6-metoxy-1,4-benzoquinol methylase
MSTSDQMIGKVRLRYLDAEPDTSYSDGEAEDLLLEIFQSDDAAARRAAALADEPSWPIYYHLTPKRATLLRWYEFAAGSSVLEVGAGPGAITEVLVEKPVQVTALELTERRSLINAHRNRDADDLTVVVGNLQSFTSERRYDYIVCVGVLEYSASFIDSETPYIDFLSMLAEMLEPGGKLLIAIENRLGLKYWTGAAEDHTGGYFDGLNDYPGAKKVQTFGRKELVDLLHEAGLDRTYFYYPFPDYKTPAIVYSDDLHPGHGAEFPLALLPTPTLDAPREVLLSEQHLMRILERNGLFPWFSNSFLVEAGR